MGPELDALGPYELERGDIGQHSLDVAAHRLDEAQKGLQRREQGSDAVIDGSRAAPCCNLLSAAADASNAQSGTDLIFDLRGMLVTLCTRAIKSEPISQAWE